MRKAIPLLAAIVLALATAGVAIAHRNGNVTLYSDLETSHADIQWNGDVISRADIENLQNGPCGFPRCGRMGRGGLGFGPMISMSEEFKENVINIAESDPDVQDLLDAGYENVHIQPIINATVQGNGDVTIKATEAIVTLCRNWDRASVLVDLEAGKVTKIVTVERTVIDKS